jgi:hypothetical protein
LLAPKKAPIFVQSGNPLLAKVVATFMITLFTLSAFLDYRSIWSGAQGYKFVFNNLALATAGLAVVCIVLLAVLQKGLYTVGNNKNIKMDERQLKIRSRVFEQSYKISALILLVTFIVLDSSKSSLPAILNNATTFNVTPSVYFLPFFNVFWIIVSMPQIVAAYTVE